MEKGQVVWVPMKVYDIDFVEKIDEEDEDCTNLYVEPARSWDDCEWGFVERDGAFKIKSDFVIPEENALVMSKEDLANFFLSGLWEFYASVVQYENEESLKRMADGHVEEWLKERS